MSRSKRFLSANDARGKKNLDHTNWEAIFYAGRPFVWRDKLPKISRVKREVREVVVKKFKDVGPFQGDMSRIE